MNSPYHIILKIVSEFQRGIDPNLGVTKLMKIFYLLECWYYQLNNKRLTQLKWEYHLYGSYCFEVEDILKDKQLVSEEEIFDTDRRFRRVTGGDLLDQDIELEESVKHLITRLIAHWGARDLNELLNYVYFETAPMRHASRGDLLDISKSLEDLERPRNISLPKMDEKTVKRLKALIIKNRSKSEDSGIKLNFLPPDDPDLVLALKGMAEEESGDLPYGSEVIMPLEDELEQNGLNW